MKDYTNRAVLRLSSFPSSFPQQSVELHGILAVIENDHSAMRAAECFSSTLFLRYISFFEWMISITLGAFFFGGILAYLRRFDFYQTSSYVALIVPTRGASLDKCRIQYSEGFIEIFVDDQLVFDAHLYAHVDKNSFVVNCTSSKVEVKMTKLIFENWPHFIKKEAKIEEKPKMNWETVAKEADNEESGSVESFFQKIYEGADDDTKKAMLKSFTESGGTVLSTDWSKIKSEQTSTKPPDGTEFKKWT